MTQQSNARRAHLQVLGCKDAKRRKSSKKKRSHVWGEARLGLKKSPEEYIRALLEAGYDVPSRHVDDILLITVSKEIVVVPLVVVSVSQLGFKHYDTHYHAICEAGIERNFGMVPNEVPFALAINPKQKFHPEYEEIRLAMKPIIDRDGDSRIFGVPHRKSDADWIRGSDGRRDRRYPPDMKFMFVDLR